MKLDLKKLNPYKNEKGLRDAYIDKTGIRKHREWRGLKDSAYDYYRWLINLGTMGAFVARDPVNTIRGILEYRWMGSYLGIFNMVDKCLEGARGPALRAGHLHLNAIIERSTEYMTVTFGADRRFHGDNERADNIVPMEETIPPEIMAGFPELFPMPLQTLAGFLVCHVDKNIQPYYIDVGESYGIPADMCPRCVAEEGVAIEDDQPKYGKFMLTTSLPCDGSIMTTSLQARRYQMPAYVMAMPMRYDEPEVQEYTRQELVNMIAFIEEQSGKKFDWPAFFETMKGCNFMHECEVEKWDIESTPFSALQGVTQALYRIFNYHLSCGFSKYCLKADAKVIRLMRDTYQRQIQCFPKTRHRAVLWSCNATYYVDFTTWCYNCWGINVVMNMDTLLGHNHISTEDPEQAIDDLVIMYENAAMRRHAVGGVRHVFELWKEVENYHADMVLMFDQLSCKGMSGVHGLFEDEARKRDVDFIWVEHDLFDYRTVTRRQMRQAVNDYMYSVKNAKPLDETLVDFDDSEAW